MRLGFVLSLARRGGLPALACVVSVSSFLVYACDGGGNPENANGSALDGSGGPPAADVAVSPADGSALTATVRFVHLASNLGAVDFCLRGAGDETFTGPVLGGAPGADGGGDAGPDTSTSSGDGGGDAQSDAASDASANDGAADGSVVQEEAALAPRTMTNYVSFEGSGTFDVAVVAAGQKSCASPLATLKVTVDPSKLTTVILSGDYTANGDAGVASDAGASGTLRLFRVLDDPTLEPKQARVRMVNAAFGASAAAPAGDLRVEVIGSQKTPLADDVALGGVSNQSVSNPATDVLGYTLLAPEPPANALALTGVADASFSGTWTSVYTDLGLSAASLHTGFIVSDATDTFNVVWCSDTSTVGKRIDCRILAKPAGDL